MRRAWGVAAGECCEGRATEAVAPTRVSMCTIGTVL
jgi:hypothetical protein